MSKTSRQIVLGLGLAGLMIDAIASHPAFAVSKVVLFKVVTPQNEIVIGLSRDELRQMDGKTAEAVAKALSTSGALKVWQYGTRRGVSGAMEEAPVRKIGLTADATLRIEPYATQNKVVPIDEERMVDLTR